MRSQSRQVPSLILLLLCSNLPVCSILLMGVFWEGHTGLKSRWHFIQRNGDRLTAARLHGILRWADDSAAWEKVGEFPTDSGMYQGQPFMLPYQVLADDNDRLYSFRRSPSRPGILRMKVFPEALIMVLHGRVS